MDAEDKARAILDAIALGAEAKWGDRWQAELVRAYCDIEGRETGLSVKPVNRRKQIIRSFDEGTTTLESLCRIIEAVGIEIELTITEKRKL